jgi:hypothetical protein
VQLDQDALAEVEASEDERHADFVAPVPVIALKETLKSDSTAGRYALPIDAGSEKVWSPLIGRDPE